ncbi:MAG: phosphoglycerate dehydrogenase, partial [Gemmatimonadota bacterium]|nr:phosphoglycerate dehydrogenase [Gemmatimonadota bacterium]
MTFKVVVADAVDKEGLELLEGDPEFKVVSVVEDASKLPTELADAHALLVRSSTQVTADLMEKAPLLKVVGRAGIGIDNIDVNAATRRGVAVVNAPGANTVSAAEHTIALLLALVRRVPWAMKSMAEGRWDRKQFAGTELRGKTLSLIGLGRIGAHVAKIARAFGMEVAAFDPFLSADRARDLRVELGTLEDVLKLADVISLHAPSTETTHHIINEKTLALVKPTAYLVNTARGSLIDDQALADAVKSGKLAGAALDVFDPEPLPDDSPLRNVDGIALTPHLAASTQEAQTRVSVEICRTVGEVLRTG